MSSSSAAASTVPPDIVENQVSAMVEELEARWPGAEEQLRRQTLDMLVAWSQVRVRMVPESAADAECSVAGAYLGDESPPILAIAESLSHGRQAFTGLHELGHHLQQTTAALIDLLLEQPDGGRALEEAACNSFAADILIPAAHVRRHLGDASPTAHQLVALWRDPALSASRAAVCVRGAERLRSPGHVLLLDAGGHVMFGSSRGYPPVRRGADQTSIPVVMDALADPSRAHHGTTAVAYRDGITGQQLFAQAADMGGYVVLVAVLEGPPWEDRFTLPIAETGPTAQWWICALCEHSFRAFGPRCSHCRAPKCEECGRCECPAVIERRCTACFLLLPLPAFDGDSARCRDCD